MIEQVRPGTSAAGARVGLFDFDGTISLIRSGWVDVMVPMMVEILADLKTGESEAELHDLVNEFVWRLTGNPLAWAEGHAAWGRQYQGLGTLVSEQYAWLAMDGFYAYTSRIPFDLLNALGGIFVLVAATGMRTSNIAEIGERLASGDVSTVLVAAAAAGIMTALLTTVLGLVVGIPAFTAFNYFTSVINRFVLDVEESATELIEAVTLQMAVNQQSSDTSVEASAAS